MNTTVNKAMNYYLWLELILLCLSDAAYKIIFLESGHAKQLEIVRSFVSKTKTQTESHAFQRR